jgi:hypothetical protein
VAPVLWRSSSVSGRQRRASAVFELEVVKDGAHQPQPRHRAAVVDGAGDRFGLRAGFVAPAADLERSRRDVRKMEAAGVGEIVM